MSAIDNMESLVELNLYRADSEDCCCGCGLQISSERQRKLPGAVFCDECADEEVK